MDDSPILSTKTSEKRRHFVLLMSGWCKLKQKKNSKQKKHQRLDFAYHFRLSSIYFECFILYLELVSISWCIFSVIVCFLYFDFFYIVVYMKNKLWTQESHFFLLKRLAEK